MTRYLQLRAGECIAAFLLGAGTYLDYKAVIPARIVGKTILSRAALLDAAERAQIIFAPDQVEDVELAAHARDCTVEVQRVFDDHAKSAVLSETLDAQGDSWAVPVSVNVRHLVDALHSLDAEKSRCWLPRAEPPSRSKGQRGDVDGDSGGATYTVSVGG